MADGSIHQYQRIGKDGIATWDDHGLPKHHKGASLSIVYFDAKNKRNKQIDLDHVHKGMKPHTHHGYNHAEYEKSKKGASNLTPKERKLVEKVEKEWYNHTKKRRE